MSKANERDFWAGFREGFTFLIPFDRELVKDRKAIGMGAGLVAYLLFVIGLGSGVSALFYWLV